MNIFTASSAALQVFQKGRALQWSALLTNTEASAAALYALLSAIVTLLETLGLPVVVGGSDLHAMANGWTVTLSLAYSLYRIATNPAAGFGPKAE